MPTSHASRITERILFLGLLALAVLVLVPAKSFAQTGTLTDDATFPTGFPAKVLTVQGSSATGGAATTFIKFKVTPNLPPSTPGSFVSKATLRLFAGSVTTIGSFNVYRVTSSWLETNTTAPTYDSANPVLTGVQVSTAGSFVTLDLTSLVQQWLGTDGLGAGGVPNFGVALVANTSTTAFTLDSKEATTTSHLAQLDIVLNHALTADTATNFSGALAGDVTGAQNATVVSSVGGRSATSVANATDSANAATPNNTGGAIVRRDASGNFSAGTIIGSLNGNATSATTAATANSLAGSATISGSQVTGVLTNATLDGSRVTGTVANATNSVNATTASTVSVPLNLTSSGNAPTVQATNTGGGAGGGGAALLGRSNGGEPSVQGISTAVGGGAGVLGRSSDGVGTGIIGENFGGGVAILGRTGAGGGNALEARSSSATGNALFAYNDGFGTAVYGASPNGLAGRFDGPVTINGNLNVSGSTNISPSVNHDSTLSGNGTSGSPLAVVSVPNGVVTTSSYANPSWITSLDGGRITGKVASAANADTATNAVAKTGDTMTGALTLPVNGLQAGGNQLVLAGNNVGIGTANPAFKLDVAGTVNASQLSATSLKLPQGTIASDSSSLTLKGLTTAQGTTGGYLSLGSGNSYYPGGSVKLGAGAAGPDYGAAPGPFISLSGNDYSSGGDIMIASGHAYGSPTGGVITLTTSSASGYNYPPPGYISLQIAGSESLRVASDGNVGIGTSSPAAKFHVANAGATAAQFDGNITVNGNLTVSGSSNVSATVNHDPTLSGNGSSGSPLAVVSAPNGVVTTASYANPSWITSLDGNKITAGTVVKTVNGLTDSVTLAAGSNVTITPSGNTLTINATAAVQKVNPQQVAMLRWYEARSGISFPVGVNPQEMAFDGSNIWVINGGSNSVTKFSANDGSVLGTYAVGAGPNEILFDGANIWVANIVGSITKLRASDGALVGTYPTDKPTGLTFDGTFIWVANNNSGELTKIRASDGSTSLGKGMNGNPYKIVFDGASYWYTLPFHGGVCRFNPAVGDNCLDLGPNTQGLAFDGTNIWVATYGDNTVKKIRVSDRTLVGTYAVGSGPLRVVFDGVNIWVTNTLSNTVTKLRASDGSNLGDFSTGSSPVGIVFDGANVWVSNANSNTISKF